MNAFSIATEERISRSHKVTEMHENEIDRARSAFVGKCHKFKRPYKSLTRKAKDVRKMQRPPANTASLRVPIRLNRFLPPLEVQLANVLRLRVRLG